MSEKELVVLKLVTGEEIVGERVPTTLPVIKLKNILVFEVVQTGPGQLSPTVRPWIHSCREFEHDFKPEEVLVEVMIPAIFVRDAYMAVFSPIKLIR